jgi:DNA polymerase III gamma/tau subunit
MKQLPNDWNITLRPKTVEDVYGYDPVKSSLRRYMKSGNFDKCYAFFGEPGSGKTTFALLIAQAIVCQHKDENGNPCGECEDCQAILNQTFNRGVKMLDGNDKEEMGADAARAYLAEFTSSKGGLTGGKAKVLIIDEAGKLSAQAISAFLKPLENPREGFYYIFTSMDTVTSAKEIAFKALQRRATQYKLQTPDAATIYMYLASIAKKLELTDPEYGIPKEFWGDGLNFIATNSASYGVALKYMSTCVNGGFFDKKAMRETLSLIDEENLYAALDALCAGDLENDAIEQTFISLGGDYQEMVNFAGFRLAQASLIRQTGSLNDDWREKNALKLASMPYFDIVNNEWQIMANAGFVRKSNFYWSLAKIFSLIKETKKSMKSAVNSAALAQSASAPAPVRRVVAK